MSAAIAASDAAIASLAKKIAPLVAQDILSELRSLAQSTSVQPDRRPLSIDEAADWTGLSRATINRRIADGTLQVFRVGRAVRINASELEKLAAG